MEITTNTTTRHQLSTPTTQATLKNNQSPSQETTTTQIKPELSSTSQAVTQAFQQAVDWLQQESVEPFQGRMDQLSTVSVNIDVGRYNLYLVDKKVNELQEQLGNSVDIKEMRSQLIQASGITTENPLNAANRSKRNSNPTYLI